MFNLATCERQSVANAISRIGRQNVLGNPRPCGKLCRLSKQCRQPPTPRPLTARISILERHSADPEQVNSSPCPAGKSSRLTRYNVSQGRGEKEQHGSRRNTVTLIAGLSRRQIRTPGERRIPLRDSLRRPTLGGLRGGPSGGGEPLVAIVEQEEKLAHVAATAGMASSDVGAGNRRRNSSGQRGHELFDQRSRGARAKENRQASRHVRRDEQAGRCTATPPAYDQAAEPRELFPAVDDYQRARRRKRTTELGP